EVPFSPCPRMGPRRDCMRWTPPPSGPNRSASQDFYASRANRSLIDRSKGLVGSRSCYACCFEVRRGDTSRAPRCVTDALASAIRRCVFHEVLSQLSEVYHDVFGCELRLQIELRLSQFELLDP